MLVGIVGGGQLGKMMVLAGIPLGITFRILDPDPNCPAGQVAACVQGEYNDLASLAEFSRGLDVVTYEFENVPASTIDYLSNGRAAYPPARALSVSQDRFAEKQFFRQLGVPTPAFRVASSLPDLLSAGEHTGHPCIIKTRRFGYDGKGQRMVRSASEMESAWPDFADHDLIVEQMIPFDFEASVVAVSTRAGEITTYPLVTNKHVGGILRNSTAPVQELTGGLDRQATTIARVIIESLSYVGCIAIEFFVSRGTLIANEIAPRVHNSGHWTIEGAETSQFENHIRAICGLASGSTRPIGHSVMLNLIGSVPPIDKLADVPGAHVHIYGKPPRPGRKLGHVTCRADTAELAADAARKIQALIDTAATG